MGWKRGEKLGSGSFGFVSLAEVEDDGLGRLPPLMAVKSAEISRSSSLQKEVIILQELESCPHVIRCFGSDVTRESGTDELYNILLEYARGGSLAHRLQLLRDKGSVMSEAEVRRHTKTLLVALGSIHSHGYVHCDMKPLNILIMDEEALEVKIADFGLAKRVGEGIDTPSVVWGTPLYVAPESRNQEYEPPFDVWGLGCTVLEMITGKAPWKIDEYTSLCSILFKIACTDQIPDIPSWVSTEAKDFLGKCFVKDPKSRWTVDMLLQHPFVTSSPTAENQPEINACKRSVQQEEGNGTRRQPFRNICWKVKKPGEAFGRRNAIPVLGF